MPLELKCPVLLDTGFLPRKYAGNGDDVSPPLQWSDAPEGTRSFALTLDDPNVEGGRNHWLIFDIDGQIRELPEHVVPEENIREWTHDGVSVKQGKNDLGKTGYSGPVATKDRPHDYTFTLYALDCKLRVPASCRKAELLSAMYDHILDRAQIVARYNE